MKTKLLGLSIGLGLLLLWAALRSVPRAPDRPSAPQVAQPSAAAPSAEPISAPKAAAEQSPPAPAAAAERPLPTIRLDYEREPRDASAAAAERQIREIFAGDPNAAGILREVRCSETVCKLDARWSRQSNAPYNAALVKVVAAFSREMTFETAGPPDGAGVPMTVYVRRALGVSAQR